MAGLLKLSKAMQDMAENEDIWSKDRNNIAQTSAVLTWLVKVQLLHTRLLFNVKYE